MEGRGNGNPQKRFKNAAGAMQQRKKQPPFNGDIVFTSRNGSIQTMPSLAKRLKSHVTGPIIGLQYVWEFRSPSKSVPPHYQCKLCKVQRLQNEMAAHVSGWKHCFRYMKRNHPDKVPHEEEEAVKDPAIRKAIKETAAEVEKAEGRGQLRVMLKEPSEVGAFQGMSSAQAKPSMGVPGGLGGMGPRGPQPGGRFGGGFPDPMCLGEFPPQGGMLSDFGGFSDFGSLPRGGPSSDLGGFTSPGRYGNPMVTGGDRSLGGMRDGRFPDEGPMRMSTDGFGIGQRGEGAGLRPYSNSFPSNHGNSNISDRMMGAGAKAPESNSIPATLLKYLDTFRIENENDAQIVLKVTQKLTDVLMEYRLRSISTGSSMKATPSSSMSSMNFSSRLPSTNDRFSSSMSGTTHTLSGSGSPPDIVEVDHLPALVLILVTAMVLVALLVGVVYLYRSRGSASAGAYEGARYSRTNSTPSEQVEKNILVSDMELNEQAE